MHQLEDHGVVNDEVRGDAGHGVVQDDSQEGAVQVRRSQDA